MHRVVVVRQQDRGCTSTGYFLPFWRLFSFPRIPFRRCAGERLAFAETGLQSARAPYEMARTDSGHGTHQYGVVCAQTSVCLQVT